ncbi:MAG TPA: D-2-hydroxyacid dehydrogenase [Longimicrobiales bacterium]|nr:D-2-hydroxyacid dehydrogenase [Longimicrobiales bacterium]
MIRRLVLNFQDERSRWAITKEALTRIEAMLPLDWELVNVTAPVSSRGDGGGVSSEALDAVRDATVYAGFGFPRELFAAATKLKWVHTGTAGVASMLYPELLASDVVLTNSAGIHAPPMAETVVGMILYFARGFDFATDAKMRGVWDQNAFETTASPAREIAGARLAIIGLGGVGAEVKERAEALGMDVEGVRKQHSRTELRMLLSDCDYLLVAAPSTSETKGMLGARELGWLQPSAVVINVARGDILDENVLIEMLRKGRLRGAALDVFAQEPLPEDSPLWKLPNVFVMPHVSATTPKFWDREVELIEDNFRRFLAREELINVVDKSAGY